MNSSQLLARNAQKYPEQDAIICMKRRLSYKQLDQLVNQFGHGLLKSGIKAGDKVVLFMPNVEAFAISYFAVQRIGAIIVPINARLSIKEVDYIIDHSDASAIIAHEQLFAVAKEIKQSIIKIKTGEAVEGWLSFTDLVENSHAETIECELLEDDESTILYTSGTTGKPKGVLFSYRNIMTVAQMICVEMEVKPESRILLMMPLSHSAPLHLFFMAGIVVGCTLVLTPTFSPKLLIETVEQERTTHFFGAPVSYLLTAKLPEIRDADFSSMKWWVYGGAPLSSSEVKMVKSAFRTNHLVCVYGLTEAGPSGTLLLPDEHEYKAGSIGKRAALFTELRIVDENGRDVPIGEIGEIVLCGAGNMLGYYKNEQATKEVFIGKWLKTDDLAKRDEDGYIWIVDRKKDMIISGGVNIYPREIEDIMLMYPQITEVAVIGVKHSEWGETVKAVFSAVEKIDIDEFKSFLQQQLALYKIPRIFKQVDMLPRNATGKILKHQLRREAEVNV